MQLISKRDIENMTPFGVCITLCTSSLYRDECLIGGVTDVDSASRPVNVDRLLSGSGCFTFSFHGTLCFRACAAVGAQAITRTARGRTDGVGGWLV